MFKKEKEKKKVLGGWVLAIKFLFVLYYFFVEYAVRKKTHFIFYRGLGVCLPQTE